MVYSHKIELYNSADIVFLHILLIHRRLITY